MDKGCMVQWLIVRNDGSVEIVFFYGSAGGMVISWK